jgi:uncharacterized membrane protein
VKDLFNKRNIHIGLIYLIYMALSVILYFVSDNFIYRWLAVNLFLACLPLMFGALALTAKKRNNKPMYIAAVLFWLIFFPNAPYMITDFIHISYLGFNSYFVVVKDVMAWFGLVYMTIGVIFGMLAGLFSLDVIVKPIFKAKGRGMAVTTVAAVSIMSGYAIYIGRFLRFNSWDLFYPVSLIKMLIQDFSLFSVSFSLLIAAYIAFSYLVFCILKKN